MRKLETVQMASTLNHLPPARVEVRNLNLILVDGDAGAVKVARETFFALDAVVGTAAASASTPCQSVLTST